jgi:hypothetical protein
MYERGAAKQLFLPRCETGPQGLDSSANKARPNRCWPGFRQMFQAKPAFGLWMAASHVGASRQEQAGFIAPEVKA